ncbi:MAG: zinc dependent phospholipase C family protein [Candidatus Diapherotrites archaeon]
MAFIFTHCWIANLVLKKLKKKQFISSFENIDDYFFGSIAPDIRYISNAARAITHEPKKEESIFEALKMNRTSISFIAGYETHLITDMAWSNDKNWLDKSIYDYYQINPNVPIQKFTLYALVDDYFQTEADWFFPLICAGNILRSNDTMILEKLGFNKEDIQTYKYLASLYLREPGIDTINIFNFMPNKLDEVLVRTFLGRKSSLTNFLKEFKKTAVEQCIIKLEKYI